MNNSSFDLLQSVIRKQFALHVVNNTVTELPKTFTDKKTGEIKTRQNSSYSFKVSDSVQSAAQNAIEHLSGSGEYLSVIRNGETLNVIGTKPRNVITDRFNGKGDIELPATLIISAPVKSTTLLDFEMPTVKAEELLEVIEDAGF